MNRLLLTGDTHGDIDIHKLTTKKFPIQKELDKSDILVVLGDWGGIWSGTDKDNYMLNWWESKNFSTFVVAGNHENYDMIEQLPVVRRYGGYVRQPRPSISIAISGEIYNLNGRRCLCVNGADSIDKDWRKPHISWWKQEQITPQAIYYAMKSLERVKYNIDYLFTHTGGSEVVRSIGFLPTESDKNLDILLNKLIEKEVDYKHFLGHYHVDMSINQNTKILYDDIIEI